MIRFEQVSKAYLGGDKRCRGDLPPAAGRDGVSDRPFRRREEYPAEAYLWYRTAQRRKIFFSGHEISRLKSREVPFLRRQIGMIFQDHHLLMDRTVYDNVAIPLIIAGASGDDIRRRVSAALDKVGLLDKAKNFPIQLSGGEQQRVGIARAVVNKPAVLLADEPTGNLDEALSEGILRLFEEFNRVGVTVLMATHDLGLSPVVRTAC